MRSRLAFLAALPLMLCINAYGVQLSLPNLAAFPESEITVEISVDNAAGIAGGQMVLEYDPAVLMPEKVLLTDLTLGFLLGQNIKEAGKINLALANLPAMAGGSGAILEIVFQVKASASGQSSLKLSDVTLFDEAPNDMDVSVLNGSVTVKDRKLAIRDRTDGDPMLALEARYDQANVRGYAFVDIWTGSIPIPNDAEYFLEFQILMFSGNPVYNGTVDLHTSDDSSLEASGAEDQNGLSADPSTDLSQYARDSWYHRKISLAALAGKTIDGVMIGTGSSEHAAGVFRAYVDKIQITDGTYVIESIWTGQDTIPVTGTAVSTGTTLGGAQGMSDYSVTIVGVTPVPLAEKLIRTWGSIRNGL